MTNTNAVMTEIEIRLIIANRAYFALSSLFQSKLLSLKTKFIVYKTLVLPVLIYGSETWPLTMEIENKFNIFERKWPMEEEI